ncbi:unnamed protein product [Rotaria magnacalcarata]|uniref:C2H2-type domain-containing protein n=1 Tax=Rotaria magnacalcarata TaxID=392030 RepID=A0A819HUF9_9BILA|nr:unnamed protein product [Rotaria magnacalcarata]CAF1963585.1 unnamed protein product [Rotaria magnacalcarata]CAF3906548.1 unnamed protein product [Rotaria magnacalcarata]CAF3954980.1 unnamed protein product [Rotaria magnacalcarata]
MSHSHKSIYCSDCNTKFRSHRALKNHQQRFHLTYSQDNLPDYSYISSYLVTAFSTQQFPFITKTACEQKRLPLGNLSSKLFQCHHCFLSFPCSRTLEYHLLNQHEQYEYNLCRNILYDIVLQIEQNLTINVASPNDDSIESIKFLLSKQASSFGLIDKQLVKEYHRIKQEQYDCIFPSCQHENRTCANLCLEHLSSYNKLIKNYPYKIATTPKGNPFVHGSIVSKLVNKSTVNNSPIISKESLNTNQKRLSLKRAISSFSDDLSSSPSKKKLLSTVEQQVKTNETKVTSGEQSTSTVILSKKILTKTKPTFARSLSSMSSNSSVSTRTSSKNSRQQSITALKRSISPTITLAVERSAEKRRRQRELRRAKHSLSPTAITTTMDDMEQENDDDDDDDDDDDPNGNNLTSMQNYQSKQKNRHKQRQASNSSVEYVQILNHDQQSIPSLNNIENLNEKSKINDEEIIICHSPPQMKRTIPSSNRKHSEKSVNGNVTYKSNGHQSSDYDENVRVRCKICGDILQGRSRFSKHVLTMHSHLVKNNISTIKQQPTTIVR